MITSCIADWSINVCGQCICSDLRVKSGLFLRQTKTPVGLSAALLLRYTPFLDEYWIRSGTSQTVSWYPCGMDVRAYKLRLLSPAPFIYSVAWQRLLADSVALNRWLVHTLAFEFMGYWIHELLLHCWFHFRSALDFFLTTGVQTSCELMHTQDGSGGHDATFEYVEAWLYQNILQNMCLVCKDGIDS